MSENCTCASLLGCFSFVFYALFSKFVRHFRLIQTTSDLLSVVIVTITEMEIPRNMLNECSDTGPCNARPSPCGSPHCVCLSSCFRVSPQTLSNPQEFIMLNVGTARYTKLHCQETTTPVCRFTPPSHTLCGKPCLSGCALFTGPMDEYR